MNVYTLFPLIAVIAYVPLLITTLSSRPWQTRHKLFIVFLFAAISWSLTSVFLRSNLFPQYNFFLLKIILVTYTLTAVQFYVFLSSFFAPGEGRWLPLAYASLAVVVILIVLGVAPAGVYADGDTDGDDYHDRGAYPGYEADAGGDACLTEDGAGDPGRDAGPEKVRRAPAGHI